MKKNLNIAYLNGAEGMRKRGGDSSGGSSGGETLNKINIEYYKINRNSDSFDETAFSDIIGACCAFKKNKEVFLGSIRTGDLQDIVCCAGIAMPCIMFNYNTNDYQLVGGYNSWLENLYAIMNFYDETADYSFLEPITKEEFYNLEA